MTAERGGPIFIGGPDRSGKTIVAAIIGSHPRIAISPVGSNLWPFFYRRFGDLRDDRNLARCLRAMVRYKHVAYLNPDVDRLGDELVAGERSYERLFALLQRQYAARLGKPRWGDQTGLVERWADQILAAYPDARFIHVLRDPRDRYHASLEMWPSGKLRVGGATARWLLSAQLARRNRRRHAASYRIVQYERFVQHPEVVFRELCDFLGEEFVPEMLEMGAMPGVRAKLEPSAGLARPAGDGSPPSTLLSPDFIGAYRGRIASTELAFLQRHAGTEMAALGYTPDEISMRPLERLAYWLVTEPINLARMRGWLWREAVAHRWPGVLGRRIRAGMRR